MALGAASGSQVFEYGQDVRPAADSSNYQDGNVSAETTSNMGGSNVECSASQGLNTRSPAKGSLKEHEQEGSV